jgi:hypothetical protein
MRKLASTVHYEGALIAELAGRADAFQAVTADVLIMGGSKGSHPEAGTAHHRVTRCCLIAPRSARVR